MVKVGTNVLSRDDDTLDLERVEALAEEIASLQEDERRVILVSSGAVGAGMGLLGLKERPTALPQLQACAAAGQAKLISHYDKAFQRHGSHAAQLLLTANDFKQRHRYLNVRNTLYSLLDFGAIPVVNENDTVSIAGIRVGDNDRLAALVAGLLEEPLLVVLTVASGLLNGPPSDPTSERIPVVESLDDETLAMADDTRSSRGTGGMRSKLEAIASAVSSGITTVIADGRDTNVLSSVVRGDDIGTLFLGAKSSLAAWKRWIAHAAAPEGELILDDGAVNALVNDGRSLLPVGVVRISGKFRRGDVVTLCDRTGREFARGLTNHDWDEASAYIGRPSSELSIAADPALVHRNNLVVTQRNGSTASD